MPTQLSADAMLVIAQWRGRPDAALHLIHDVCVPAGRIADHSMMPAVEEVREAGLTDVVWDGHVLTDAGKTVLATIPPDDGYDAKTALAVLARIEPTIRDPSDPVVRWATEFLGLPEAPADSFVDGPRHPVEDGPGAGARVELTVRVLVGSERSTIVVADPISGRALERDVVQHGGEAGAAAAAVEAAIRARMSSAPGGVPGGLPEAPGEPIE